MPFLMYKMYAVYVVTSQRDRGTERGGRKQREIGNQDRERESGCKHFISTEDFVKLLLLHDVFVSPCSSLFDRKTESTIETDKACVWCMIPAIVFANDRQLAKDYFCSLSSCLHSLSLF